MKTNQRKVRRVCSVCGKKRVCRVNKTCKNGIQKMCKQCVIAACKEWYADEVNHKYKLAYMDARYHGNTDWLDYILKHQKNMTIEDKLICLFNKVYLKPDRGLDCY